MSTLPKQKTDVPAKPTLTKSTANKAATAKSASLSPTKAAVNLLIKAPLKSKSVVTNNPAVLSKPSSNATDKPATNTALKSEVQLKPKLSNGKKDNGQNKKNDHKDDKKIKIEKVKMERDSFTMPKDEYAQLALLKGRLNTMGQPAKKSELLRAGIKLLAAMSDNTLKTTLAKVPVIKTGRPNK